MNPFDHEKIDTLTEWSLPIDLQSWLARHRAPDCESAVVKDVP